MIKKKVIILFTDIVAFILFISKKLLTLCGLCKNEQNFRILVYHSIVQGSYSDDMDESTVSEDLFKKQMIILKKNKNVISLKEGIEGIENNCLPKNSVAVSFDDGYLNTHKRAPGILSDLNIPATFFIIYKYLDGQNNALAEKMNYINWPMLFLLKEKGFAIGCHSYSHRRLGKLGDEDLSKEIIYPKKKFEEQNLEIDYFAYPYGFYADYNEKIKIYAKNAGYKACLTNVMGGNKPGDDMFELKRTRISWRDKSFRFRMRISGAYDWVDRLKHILKQNNNKRDRL